MISSRISPYCQGVIMNTKIKNKGIDKEYLFSLILIIPAVLIILLLVIYPLFSGIKFSFYKHNLMSSSRPFIGFGNYAKIFSDPVNYQIMWNTVFYAFTANLVSSLVGLSVALLLNKSGRFTGVLRGLGYLPWITPGVVFAFVWNWIFSKNFGPINAVLLNWGWIDSPLSLLGDVDLKILGLSAPVFSVLLVRVWASFPFKMVMFLAALQNIPNEHYEAARIDGANYWQQFRHIVVPAIMSVFLIVFSISMIWNLSHFEVNYLMTNGGPKNLTNVMTIFIYNKAFVHYNIGEASAASVLVFIVAGLIGAVYMFLAKRESDYAD